MTSSLEDGGVWVVAPWSRLARSLAVIVVLAGAALVASQPPLSRDPAQLRAGRLLYAVPMMGDSNFAQTVILLIKHGRDGSLGVVINQPSTVSLRKALPNIPDARRSELPVYWGGPVEPEGTIVLLREPGASGRSERVLPGVYLGTDVDDLRAALAAPRPDRAVRVYAGYAGRSPGQLETEMQKRQWVLDEADASLVFAPDPTELWERVHAILARREARVTPRPSGHAAHRVAASMLRPGHPCCQPDAAALHRRLH
ncbi:MAG: YqgE/AlgH family protein [Acidobacteria bacterium]|nr:YqgE/AlgH family protein [Acidobacteriota bacterium]